MSDGLRNPYIAFEGVEVEYSEFVYGLRGVTLHVDRGEFAFFVGPTGAGKSTLLKLLTREVRTSKGKVLFHGRDVSRLRDRDVPMLRREMGIVPQDFALLPRKRVWENVAYAMRAVGATRREVRRRVPEILERVNIGHRADAFPAELSGGEQQRVAIGRALINNPSLLIADEPTGNLDPAHSWEIMELLKQLNIRGTTVLVASHDMMVIERMGKRIVTLEQGRVVHDTALGEERRETGNRGEEPAAPLPVDEPEEFGTLFAEPDSEPESDPEPDLQSEAPSPHAEADNA